MKQCIALYLRLSDDDKNIDGKIKVESNSVTTQRKLLIGFVKEQKEFEHMSLVEYTDDGYSGTNFNRPSFQRMMEDARSGRIAVIVIKDFSRFGRDYLEVGNYLEKILPLLGVRIISVNDRFDSGNYSGVTGGMDIALKNVLNAMYSKDISGKVRTAMAAHAMNGEYMTSRPAYGYTRDPGNRHHLIIDTEAAEIVRRIFTMAADGVKRSRIAFYLNENNVLTCKEYAHRKNGIFDGGMERKLWSQTTISDILRNQIYIGNTIWSKKSIITEKTHEPIVSEELFAKANERAFSNRKRPDTPREKPCPILKCPVCGRSLVMNRNSNSYRCIHASISGLPGCANSRIDKSELENTVLTCAGNMAQSLSDNIENAESRIYMMECEKKRITSGKMDLYSDYRNKKITREQYKLKQDKLTNKIAEIQRNIQKAGEMAALKQFDKKALSKIIDRVYVYSGERIEIIWKMDDIFKE